VRTGVAALATYAVLVVPVALLDPAAFVERAFARAPAGPGLGIVNLLAFWGAESVGAALAPLLALAALGGSAWLFRRPWSRPAGAGIASLVGIVAAPSLSADAVAVPLLLLTLAALASRSPAESAAGSDV
jgi:hypothetical protein